MMEIYTNQANWHENLQLAESTLRAALAASPADIDLLTCVGAVLCDQARYPEALAALTAALQLGSRDANTYVNLGVALLNSGKHKEAKSMFGRAGPLAASTLTWTAYFDPMAH